MEETVDELVDMIESKLTKKGIELDIDELDEIRDKLDEVLEKYEER